MPATLFRRVLLPALLLLAVGWGLGGYFETNDDAAIILLLRGTTAAAPVPDLHLYFHGLSALLMGLYQLAPAVPWYALLLYGLLYAATVGAFTFLDRLLAGRVPASWVTVLLVLFFVVAWLEHGFWFNYVRVPVLLAGVGLLLAVQRPASRRLLVLGVLAFGISWLIRPSAALLGLLAVVPGAWWLSGRQALPVLAGALLWAGLGAALLGATQTAPAKAYRTLDVLKSNLNDYQLYRPTPRTAPDSLGMRAVRHWLLADSALVNPALFRRAGTLDVPYFLRETAPAKAGLLLRQLARDYFPLLLLQAVLLGLVLWQHSAGKQPGRRRWFWLAQAGYVGFVLALGIILKLPPRVALPLLDLWALSNLAHVLPRAAPSRVRGVVALLLAALALAAGPYAYKTLHRRQILRAEQLRGQSLRRALAGPPVLVVVADVLPYKAANAFRNPDPRPVRLLLLAGWTSADPSQPLLRQRLSGTRSDPASLVRLLRRGAAVRWLLTPTGAALVNQQLLPYQPAAYRLVLVPAAGPAASPSDEAKLHVPRVERLN